MTAQKAQRGTAPNTAGRESPEVRVRQFDLNLEMAAARPAMGPPSVSNVGYDNTVSTSHKPGSVGAFAGGEWERERDGPAGGKGAGGVPGGDGHVDGSLDPTSEDGMNAGPLPKRHKQ